MLHPDLTEAEKADMLTNPSEPASLKRIRQQTERIHKSLVDDPTGISKRRMSRSATPSNLASRNSPSKISELPLHALRSAYFQLESSQEKLSEENERLKGELNMRMESYLRREQVSKERIEELSEQVEQLLAKRDGKDDPMIRLRAMNSAIQDGIGEMQGQTARILKEHEMDLIRSFRSRLLDVQKELELEREKQSENAAEWIEKVHSLGKKLDWAKEEALRLDYLNQILNKENQRLKTQFNAQDGDREIMVRQVVLLRKQNAKLKEELSQVHDQAMEKGGTKRSSAGTGFDVMFDDDESSQFASRPASSPSRRPASSAASTSRAQNQLEVNEAVLRYQKDIRKLRALLERERKNLKASRAAYVQVLSERTELEALLRTCCNDVKKERLQHEGAKLSRQSNEQVHSARRSGSARSQAQSDADGDLDLADFTIAERERVIELLLSQERVLKLLYERTFPHMFSAMTEETTSDINTLMASTLNGYDPTMQAVLSEEIATEQQALRAAYNEEMYDDDDDE